MSDKPNLRGLSSNFLGIFKEFRISPYTVRGKVSTEALMVKSVLGKWTGTLTRFGIVGGIAFIFLTDWTVVADKIPFYNQKFQEKK